MIGTTKRTIATLTAAACLGGGGWAIASSSNPSSAAGGSTPATTATDTAIANTAAQSSTTPAPGAPQGQPPQQAEVTGATAEKVKAAVLAKVPGATVDRVEKDPQGYHAHITKPDGTRATVHVDDQFAVTSVDAGRGPGGPGGRGPGGRRPDEKLLTGDTAAKVKAAALAKLSGATIVRVETDADGGVYEAHVTQSDGSPATVKVDKDFKVTAVESR